jgi:Family of unknown function (DUF5752)
MNDTAPRPFDFYTQVHLPFLLGQRASGPVDLLEGIKNVPASSIYYHTHRFLLEHHYLAPEPSNDFAYWVTKILGMARLGERLASIDIVSYDSIERMRSGFVTVLSDEIGRMKRIHECQEGEEFHFMYCKTVVMPTTVHAHNLYEFLEAIGHISHNSLYYHFFEAPLRVGGGENDFGLWLKGIGEPELAQQLRSLDPYTMTLEELRQQIIRLGRKRRVRH